MSKIKINVLIIILIIDFFFIYMQELNLSIFKCSSFFLNKEITIMKFLRLFFVIFIGFSVFDVLTFGKNKNKDKNKCENKVDNKNCKCHKCSHCKSCNGCKCN